MTRRTTGANVTQRYDMILKGSDICGFTRISYTILRGSPKFADRELLTQVPARISCMELLAGLSAMAPLTRFGTSGDGMYLYPNVQEELSYETLQQSAETDRSEIGIPDRVHPGIVTGSIPQSTISSMVFLGTGSRLYARTDRRVFKTSIASIALSSPNHFTGSHPPCHFLCLRRKPQGFVSDMCACLVFVSRCTGRKRMWSLSFPQNVYL